MKESLAKANNFWQRQKSRIKTCSNSNAYCLAIEHNAESGLLAKPLRVKLEAIIFVVALLVKAISIPYEARLEYDSF